MSRGSFSMLYPIEHTFSRPLDCFIIFLIIKRGRISLCFTFLYLGVPCYIEGEFIEDFWVIVSKKGFYIGFAFTIIFGIFIWCSRKIMPFEAWFLLSIILEPDFEDLLKIQDSRISSWFSRWCHVWDSCFLVLFWILESHHPFLALRGRLLGCKAIHGGWFEDLEYSLRHERIFL
jgi:hypothetical protein